jgi:hypothetical protein
MTTATTTTNDQRPTTNDQRPTTNDKRQTTKRQNDKRKKAKNKRQKTEIPRPKTPKHHTKAKRGQQDQQDKDLAAVPGSPRFRPPFPSETPSESVKKHRRLRTAGCLFRTCCDSDGF